MFVGSGSCAPPRPGGVVAVSPRPPPDARLRARAGFPEHPPPPPARWARAPGGGAQNGEVSGPLAQYHPLDGASAPLLITAPAVGQRLRSSPDGAGSATGSGRGDEDPAAMAQVGARADLRSDMASAATEPRTVEPGAGVDPGPACVMRAQRDRIRLSAIRAIPPRTMRAQMTSPERLLRGRRRGSRPPFGDAVPNRLPPGAARADGQRAGSRVASLES